jgi:hypothetical protein
MPITQQTPIMLGANAVHWKQQGFAGAKAAVQQDMVLMQWTDTGKSASVVEKQRLNCAVWKA